MLELTLHLACQQINQTPTAMRFILTCRTTKARSQTPWAGTTQRQHGRGLIAQRISSTTTGNVNAIESGLPANSENKKEILK